MEGKTITLRFIESDLDENYKNLGVKDVAKKFRKERKCFAPLDAKLVKYLDTPILKNIVDYTDDKSKTQWRAEVDLRGWIEPLDSLDFGIKPH